MSLILAYQGPDKRILTTSFHKDRRSNSISWPPERAGYRLDKALPIPQRPA